jgi:TPR repeat protein
MVGEGFAHGLAPREGAHGARVQYSLGVMYYDGQGVPQDYAEAVRWYLA